MKKYNTQNIHNVWGHYWADHGNIVKKIEWYFRCIKWSFQRIKWGFCDRDLWNIDSYLQELIPNMLQKYKDTRSASPISLSDNYGNEDEIPNDTCHKNWDEILTKMIFLWRESSEVTCSFKNEFEDAHMKDYEEYCNKYDSQEVRKSGAYVPSMSELDEYKELTTKYEAREQEIYNYRVKCLEEAMDMLKKYYFYLWD